MGLCHMTKKSNGIVNGGNRSIGLKKGIMETGINRSIGTVDEGIEDAFGILEIWGFEYRNGFWRLRLLLFLMGFSGFIRKMMGFGRRRNQ
jgi:hypothetical protein